MTVRWTVRAADRNRRNDLSAKLTEGLATPPALRAGAVKKVPQKAGCAERYSLQIYIEKGLNLVENSALW